MHWVTEFAAYSARELGVDDIMLQDDARVGYFYPGKWEVGERRSSQDEKLPMSYLAVMKSGYPIFYILKWASLLVLSTATNTVIYTESFCLRKTHFPLKVFVPPWKRFLKGLGVMALAELSDQPVDECRVPSTTNYPPREDL